MCEFLRKICTAEHTTNMGLEREVYILELGVSAHVEKNIIQRADLVVLMASSLGNALVVDKQMPGARGNAPNRHESTPGERHTAKG